MASIASRKGKRGTTRVIQFIADDGQRPTIGLGKVSLETAKKVKAHVEELIAAKRMQQSVHSRTAAWVADIAEFDDDLHKKLADVGLVEKTSRDGRFNLGPFLDTYVASRVDVKPATKEVWSQVVRNLKEHYGTDRDIASIHEGDADGFKMYLVSQNLSSMTVSKRLQFARMFFRAAHRRKLTPINPFADVAATGVISKPQFFVTREATERILKACSPEWKVIVALARYGGLRCPSEVLSVRWSDVLWGEQRLVVTSPKTAHHEGKGQRVIPLFPELQPILSEAFEAAPEGADYVLPEQRRRSIGAKGWRNCNLRTQFERIVLRAGLTTWPRLFHALRGSRETELAREFPLHVVCNWLGNTPRIANKHYLTVTDDDFRRAAESTAAGSGTGSQGDETADCADSSEAVFSAACDSVPCSAQTFNGEDRIRTCGRV